MSIFKRKRKSPKFKNGMRIQPANYSSSFIWAIRNDSYAKAAIKREKERADLANWKFPDKGWHRPKRPFLLADSFQAYVDAGLLTVFQAYAFRIDNGDKLIANDGDKLDGDGGDSKTDRTDDGDGDNGELTYQTLPSSSSLSRELVHSYAIMEYSVYGHKQIHISIADLQYYQCSCGHFNPLPCPTHLIRPIQMIYK